MEQSAKKPTTDSGGAKDRPWELRIWSGIGVGGWFREMFRNRFHFGLTRICMGLIITVLSFMNSLLWLVQEIFLGRKIKRTEIKEQPVFVLGHWRSGTTLLHELLVCDPRHTYPDTFSCFAPNHFVLSRWLFSWWLWMLLPRSRPMDNMNVGLDSPQEDEWALCNMGVPSPYLTLMFPNHPPAYPEYLDMRGLPRPAIERWKASLLWFIKCLTLRTPGRVVLKTPQHTCRIKTLLELFPDARFVHIVRDPYTIYPSTIKLWKRMYRYHGLQNPRYEGLEEHVFKTLNRMYDVFEEDHKLVDPSRFYEIRYEDLVADPAGKIKELYERLDLGDYENARPGVERYVERTKDYKVNRHELPEEMRDQITKRWGKYIERYGYGRTSASEN